MTARMRAMAPDDNGDLQEVIIVGKAVDPSERVGGMRLNNEMRSEVIKLALDHGFDKERKRLLTVEQAIAKQAWLKCFSEAKLKHARALGEPFAYEGVDIYGNKQPDGIPIQWCINGCYFTLKTQLPLPAHTNSHNKQFRVKDAPDLLARAKEWNDAVEEYKIKTNKANATLSAMLAKISTYPSLEKNWPAGAPFYKHLPKKYPFRHQVPAVLIEELNAALGI